MADFLEKIKQYKIHELLKILLESEKYTPQVTEIAKTELANRGISGAELQKILNQLSQRDKGVKKEQLEVEYTRKTEAGTETVIIDETEDPALQRRRTIDSQIIVLSILFGLITINNFTSESSLLKHFFASNLAILNFDSFSYLLLLFMLPMGIFTFWLRYKTGWLSLTIYSICSLIMSFCLTAVSLDWMILDLFYIMGSPLQYVLNTILYLVLLYVLMIPDLRSVFNISKQIAILTTVGTVILTLVLLYSTL